MLKMTARTSATADRPRISNRTATLLLALSLFASATVSAQLTAPEGTVGPDVTVYSLHNFGNGYGSSGDIRAYSVGTVSCNIGDAPLSWCDNGGGCGPLTDDEHPVIAQNLYRLKNGRFEQVGASWLKHGFLSLNTPAGTDCVGPGNQQCTSPPLGGNQLGIGCTDAYDASLNGSRPMGRKSEVNATTGVFPFPYAGAPTSTVVDQRLQVAIADIDPTLNAGAIYWAEGHYIASDDAAAGNALNNASYRLVTVAPTTFNLAGSGGTVRERAAIRAWATADPLVELANADVLTPGGITERFHVGRKVTEPVTGTWHYEYVIHNMNSDRSAQRFAIDFADGTTITNVGFRDVNSHSGEPYATDDWGNTVDGTAGSISWQTEIHSANPNANALRWATMYSYWFDADAPPADIEHETITLFTPGNPCRVEIIRDGVFLFADDFETENLCAWSAQTTS